MATEAQSANASRARKTILSSGRFPSEIGHLLAARSSPGRPGDYVDVRPTHQQYAKRHAQNVVIVRQKDTYAHGRGVFRTSAAAETASCAVRAPAGAATSVLMYALPARTAQIACGSSSASDLVT